jgi:uncharacterized protein
MAAKFNRREPQAGDFQEMSDLMGTSASSLGRTDSVPTKDGLRRIFVDKNGIRAGWSALLFITIYLALNAAATLVLGRLIELEPKGPLSPALVFVQESSDLLVIFATIWVMSRIEHRPLVSYGYSGERRVRLLLWGALSGLVGLSGLIAVLWKARLIEFNGLASSGSAAFKFALAWGCIALLVGVFEESLLRGYLQYTLTRGIGFWWASLLLSAAFALWHLNNGGETILGLIVVGLGGLVFCLSLWFTKSLWWAIGFHAGWDWGQSYLYGTPDSGLITQGHLLRSRVSGQPLWSGGLTGPEGSLLMLPLLIVIAVLMWLWWGRKRIEAS